MNDHDLLIRLDQKMDDIKEGLGDLPCAAHTKRMDTMVTRTWFRWIMGFVIAGLLCVAGIGSANKMALTEIRVEQKVMHETLKNGGIE